jgi:hypothetical protein
VKVWEKMVATQIFAAGIACALLFFTINMDLFVELMKKFENKDDKDKW